jgi:hypothetical protein
LITATHGEQLHPRTIDKWRERYLTLGQLLQQDPDGRIRTLWNSVNWPPRAFVDANLSSIEDDRHGCAPLQNDYHQQQQQPRPLDEAKQQGENEILLLPEALCTTMLRARIASPTQSAAQMDTGRDASMTDHNGDCVHRHGQIEGAVLPSFACGVHSLACDAAVIEACA